MFSIHAVLDVGTNARLAFNPTRLPINAKIDQENPGIFNTLSNKIFPCRHLSGLLHLLALCALGLIHAAQLSALTARGPFAAVDQEAGHSRRLSRGVFVL